MVTFRLIENMIPKGLERSGYWKNILIKQMATVYSCLTSAMTSPAKRTVTTALTTSQGIKAWGKRLKLL